MTGGFYFFLILRAETKFLKFDTALATIMIYNMDCDSKNTLTLLFILCYNGQKHGADFGLLQINLYWRLCRLLIEMESNSRPKIRTATPV